MIESLQSPQHVRDRTRAWQLEGLSVGLVPTMGALHEGHLSLLKASVSECDRTVVSVFVNPAQFGPDEDLEQYPRRLRSDRERLTNAGADVMFAPTEQIMYPPGFCTYVVQEALTDRLCGAFRPGHFRGVLTVVAKLLHIVPADRAYFGRKDFQQSVVLRRMAADLNMPVCIRVMPTVREPNGLAISSRNEYLTPAQRREAVCLHRALVVARELFQQGESAPESLVAKMQGVLGSFPLVETQYVEIVSPQTLEPVEEATESSVAALAVFVGQVRLIDNAPLGGQWQDLYVSRDS